MKTQKLQPAKRTRPQVMWMNESGFVRPEYSAMHFIPVYVIPASPEGLAELKEQLIEMEMKVVYKWPVPHTLSRAHVEPTVDRFLSVIAPKQPQAGAKGKGRRK